VRGAVIGLVLLVGLAELAGCSSRSGQPADRRAPSRLSALGDSVPAGSACRCQPYPPLVGGPARTANDAVPGYRSQDVVDQLDQDRGAQAEVARSSVVLIEVGANDVAETEACGIRVACYQPDLGPLRANLDRIVARVHQLDHTRPLQVVLIDYWSVWLAGQYAQDRGAAYVSAADRLTAQVNAVIVGVADRTGSVHVDLVRAFSGPDGTDDETDLLAPDGDHPNAAGQARIAQAVEQALRRT
jgi:acyl-CoA thioesterase I